mmetsp:Transcript_21170/g.63713  ORF Transcript_21170/g.63713 Transcript_21170/m.63713 type:complete len:210 (-) Transcript_21170:605-1234(-)
MPLRGGRSRRQSKEWQGRRSRWRRPRQPLPTSSPPLSHSIPQQTTPTFVADQRQSVLLALAALPAAVVAAAAVMAAAGATAAGLRAIRHWTRRSRGVGCGVAQRRRPGTSGVPSGACGSAFAAMPPFRPPCARCMRGRTWWTTGWQIASWRRRPTRWPSMPSCPFCSPPSPPRGGWTTCCCGTGSTAAACSWSMAARIPGCGASGDSAL